MGKHSDRKVVAYLPLVIAATFLVAIAPMLLVLWLRTSGTVTSVWAGMVIGIVASFLASIGGAALWKTRAHSRDILFSDLMLWGWVQRWRTERHLDAAADLLGLTSGRHPALSGRRLTSTQKTGLLTRLTSDLEARDDYTFGHSRRVARHAGNIAKRMGLPRDQVAKIRAAGAMHDVGKVKTPIAVLRKPGALTDEEYAIVKRHPVDGAVMVAALDDPELTAMVRHHHERLDGTGYPDGLPADEIPIGARILAVADTFDAITSTRPYRHAHSHKDALDILTAEAGSQLDPDAVRAFCSCYSGRWALAYWTVLAHGRPRIVSLLGGGVGSSKASGFASVMAGAAASVAVGGAVVGLAVDAPPAISSERTQIAAVAPPRLAAREVQARSALATPTPVRSRVVAGSSTSGATPPLPSRTASRTTTRHGAARVPTARAAGPARHSARRPGGGAGTAAGAPTVLAPPMPTAGAVATAPPATSGPSAKVATAPPPAAHANHGGPGSATTGKDARKAAREAAKEARRRAREQAKAEKQALKEQHKQERQAAKDAERVPKPAIPAAPKHAPVGPAAPVKPAGDKVKAKADDARRKADDARRKAKDAPAP